MSSTLQYSRQKRCEGLLSDNRNATSSRQGPARAVCGRVVKRLQTAFDDIELLTSTVFHFNAENFFP